MSLSDDSDLTDIDDTESEFEAPLSAPARAPAPPPGRSLKASVSANASASSISTMAPRTRSGGRRKKEEYTVFPAVNAPRTTSFPTQAIYTMLQKSQIDLDPEYQRAVVWQDSKMTGLIDSVLRNWYIPPIIFSKTINSKGEELRTCIDGKQRLTAIQRFIDGQIPHKDTETNKKYWFKHSGKGIRSKQLLPENVRQIFLWRQIVCVEYDAIEEDKEREIFQRVQMGLALTPAERMQALLDPAAKYIRSIEKQFVEGLDGHVEWDHGRGRGFHNLAVMGYEIAKLPLTAGDFAFPEASRLTQWVAEFIPTDKFKKSFERTCAIYVALAQHKKYQQAFNVLLTAPEKFSPVEFIMTGVLIQVHRGRLSLEHLSDSILCLRKFARKEFRELRSNPGTTKKLYAFIKEKLPQLVPPDANEKTAFSSISVSALWGGGTSVSTTAQKRKRPVEDDSEDDRPLAKVPSPKVKAAASIKTFRPKAGDSGTAKQSAASTTTKGVTSTKKPSISTSASATSSPSKAAIRSSATPSLSRQVGRPSKAISSDIPAPKTVKAPPALGSSKSATPDIPAPFKAPASAPAASTTPSSANASASSASTSSEHTQRAKEERQSPQILANTPAICRPPRPQSRAASASGTQPAMATVPSESLPLPAPPRINTNIGRDAKQESPPAAASAPPAASSTTTPTAPERVDRLRAIRDAKAKAALGQASVQSPVVPGLPGPSSSVSRDPRPRPSPVTPASAVPSSASPVSPGNAASSTEVDHTLRDANVNVALAEQSRLVAASKSRQDSPMDGVNDARSAQRVNGNGGGSSEVHGPMEGVVPSLPSSMEPASRITHGPAAMQRPSQDAHWPALGSQSHRGASYHDSASRSPILRQGSTLPPRPMSPALHPVPPPSSAASYGDPPSSASSYSSRRRSSASSVGSYDRRASWDERDFSDYRRYDDARREASRDWSRDVRDNDRHWTPGPGHSYPNAHSSRGSRGGL